MRIAIIGSGISGLAAGYLLSRRHEVHLFERDSRLGGHTHTVMIDGPDGPVALDSGFLVHNDRTYPNLVRLFRETGVETRLSDMSFSVSCPRTGLEYSSRGAGGFFAQRRNIVRPRHLKLLADIVRFNRRARTLIADAAADRITVGEFLDREQFGGSFTEQYLFPMASAIWSASFDGIRSFPAGMLARFFDNHGMLGLTTSPKWKVVSGGSSTYIPKLTAPFAERIHAGASIVSVERDDDSVTLRLAGGATAAFDHVVLACHGPQVLPLLAAPTAIERDVFSRFSTARNDVLLHTDARLLPRTAAARASWNYQLGGDPASPPTVTYSLNSLQGLSTRTQYCVTLNPGTRVEEQSILRRFVYDHPQYTVEAIRAQSRWAEVSGVARTHYCGAYWFYGFHEDGLNSAIRVASALGVAW